MPFGTRQSPLYAMRGNYADGMGIRNRGGEQYHSASGNPNMPIFNTPRPGMPAGQPQQMQASPNGAPTNEQLYAAQQQQGNFMPQFNSGAMAPMMGQGSFGNIQQLMGQQQQLGAMPPQQAFMPARPPMPAQQQQMQRPMPQFRWR